MSIQIKDRVYLKNGDIIGGIIVGEVAVGRAGVELVEKDARSFIPHEAILKIVFDDAAREKAKKEDAKRWIEGVH